MNFYHSNCIEIGEMKGFNKTSLSSAVSLYFPEKVNVSTFFMITKASINSNYTSPYTKRRRAQQQKPEKIDENISNDYSDPSIIEDDDSIIFSPNSPTKMDKQYQDLIYLHLQQREPFYMADYLKEERTCQRPIQSDHRKIVLDWMFRVCEEMKFLDETLFVAVTLFDRVISIHQIKKRHIQLFGGTCLWIASKLEEILTPALSDFVYLCGNAYVESEFIDCERVIVNILHFQIASTGPLFFMKSIVKEPVLIDFAFFFCRAMVFHEDFGNTQPSVIAASAIFLSSAVVGEFPQFGYFKVNSAEVSECAAKIAISVSEITMKAEGILYEELQDLCEETGISMKDIGQSLVKNVNANTIQHFCSQ